MYHWYSHHQTTSHPWGPTWFCRSHLSSRRIAQGMSVGCSSNEIHLGAEFRVVDQVDQVVELCIILWLLRGVLVTALPVQGPSHSPPTHFVEDAEVLVCKVRVLAGPVCLSEIMGPGQGFVPAIQIPHGVGDFGVRLSCSLGILESKDNGESSGGRVRFVAREN